MVHDHTCILELGEYYLYPKYLVKLFYRLHFFFIVKFCLYCDAVFSPSFPLVIIPQKRQAIDSPSDIADDILTWSSVQAAIIKVFRE